MKKFISICLAIMAVLGYNIKVGALSAQSYAVLEVESGRLLYASNENTRLPIASTTKVMTAIIALETADITQQVKIPKEAVGIEGSSISLKENEVLTIEELLFGLMLSSGNDAAYAIAIAVGGCASAFVEKMNLKAYELGMTNTHFVNPCGLQDKNHYSTAYDMALLSAYTMQNEQFKTIVGTMNKIVCNDETTRYLYNKNKILGQYSGGNGVKIGYTKAAGRCLCAAAKRENMQLVCVVLNDGNWFNDAMSLMDKAFDEFDMCTAIDEKMLLGTALVQDGRSERVAVTAKNRFSYPLRVGEMFRIKPTLATLFKAPVAAGQIAGKVDIYLNSEKIGTVDVVCAGEVEKKSVWERIREKIL